MAGDWIKFEHATLDKPEVLVMADMLETTPDDVIGKLLRVWIWFDKQSRDGYAGGVTGNALMFFIDRHVARNGFAACMKKVGWLGDDCLPNFDRHNGETAKNRALSKDRMQRKRYANVTPEPSPEKRREEKKKQTKKTGADAPDGFLKFWEAWPKSPRKGGRSDCLKRWRSKDLESQAAVILAHVEAMKSGRQWSDPQFIPAPATYINKASWDGAEGVSADNPYAGVTW